MAAARPAPPPARRAATTATATATPAATARTRHRGAACGCPAPPARRAGRCRPPASTDPSRAGRPDPAQSPERGHPRRWPAQSIRRQCRPHVPPVPTPASPARGRWPQHAPPRHRHRWPATGYARAPARCPAATRRHGQWPDRRAGRPRASPSAPAHPDTARYWRCLRSVEPPRRHRRRIPAAPSLPLPGLPAVRPVCCAGAAAGSAQHRPGTAHWKALPPAPGHRGCCPPPAG